MWGGIVLLCNWIQFLFLHTVDDESMFEQMPCLYDSQNWISNLRAGSWSLLSTAASLYQNSALHIVGTQSVLAKCTKHSYYRCHSVAIILNLQAGVWELTGLSMKECFMFVTVFLPSLVL